MSTIEIFRSVDEWPMEIDKEVLDILKHVDASPHELAEELDVDTETVILVLKRLHREGALKFY